MSATRRSDRKPKANTRLNDLADSSPTQPKSQPASRKRKASGGHALPTRQRRQRRQQTPEEQNADTEPEDEDDDEGDNNTDEEDSQELVDMIVPFLDVNENEPVLAVHEHANSKVTENGRKDITAYAKICGREWTYYVRKPHITFGREPDKNDEVKHESSDPVDVDLGPSKTVSRKHAELYFHATEGKWHVAVFGRNGVKINDGQMKKNDDRAIQSGDVLGIAGTQMLFQAASGKAVIHPMFVDKMLGPERLNGSDPSGGGVTNAQSQQVPETTAPVGVFQPQTTQYGPPQSMYGQMPIAPAPAGYPVRPVTPTTTPQKGPSSSSKKRSPGGQYRRPIMMESTESIDYAADSSRDLKPSCSYAAMITWAILSSPDETLSLSGIYDWIKKHYAFYRLVPSGWQNSIRHNLSLNSAFEKVARRSDEPGKGMKWCIVPEKRAETIAAAEKNASKGGGRTSSAPGSPAGASVIGGGFPMLGQAPHLVPNGSPINFQQAQGQPQYQYHQQQHPQQNRPPGAPQEQQGPAMSSFPSSQPPQPPGTPTPSQGQAAQLPVYAPADSNKFPQLSEQTSPPADRSSTRLPLGMDSSPTLNSRGWNSGDYQDYTPLPRAHNLNHLQPNTAHLPSKFIGGIESSPAPFFRYTGDSGSTPARPIWNDSSPAKANGQPAILDPFVSSSPPPATNGIGAVGAESPTRKSGSRPASSSKPPPSLSSLPSGPGSAAMSTAAATSVNGDVKGGGGEEEIDLVKGFKPISKFHEQRFASAAGTAS